MRTQSKVIAGIAVALLVGLVVLWFAFPWINSFTPPLYHTVTILQYARARKSKQRL